MQRTSKMAEEVENEVSDLEEVARKGQVELDELEIVSWSDKLEMEKQVHVACCDWLGTVLNRKLLLFRRKIAFTRKSRASVAPSRVTRRRHEVSRITFASWSEISKKKRRDDTRLKQWLPRDFKK